jgi:hypothetical protein
MSRLGSLFGSREVAFVVGTLAAAALALTVPLARGSNDGGGGGGYPVACIHSGITPSSGQPPQYSPCPSGTFESSFQVYKAGSGSGPGYCPSGYYVTINAIVNGQPGPERWERGPYCPGDGIVHYSDPWPSNEPRIAAIWQAPNSATWVITDYRR